MAEPYWIKYRMELNFLDDRNATFKHYSSIGMDTPDVDMRREDWENAGKPTVVEVTITAVGDDMEPEPVPDPYAGVC